MHTKAPTPQRLLELQRQHHPKSKAVSLQTNEAKAHDELGLTPARPDWSATLQSIGQCKAVISVDTAVAHLAAGNGTPVHLLWVTRQTGAGGPFQKILLLHCGIQYFSRKIKIRSTYKHQ